MCRNSVNSQLTSHYNLFPLSKKKHSNAQTKAGITLQTPLLQCLVIIERFKSL